MSFALDIRKFKEKVGKRSRTVFQKIALDIDKGLVLSTPVDTGQARGGWNAGLNGVNLSETDNDKSGRKTISENEAKIQQSELGDVIYLSNNVNHIKYLDKGSSDQAPSGMVAKTLRRFQGIVSESVSIAKRENP